MQTYEKKYCIKGMSCAACVARVEKAVSKVEGVDSCAVNLLTNDMKINGQVDSSKIIKAVRDAGYDAWLEDEAATSGNGHGNSEKGTSSSQTHQLINRIVFSLLFLLPLMYLSMGHNMFGFVLPPFLEKNPLSIALSQLVLCISVLVINRNFFVSGFKSAFHLSPNMDTLISLGSGVSFVWSLVQLFVMSDLYSSGQMQDASHVRHNLYFESSAMILVLITVGKTLEAYSKGKTTSALNSLKNLVPKTVTVLKDGEEKTVPLEQIQAGDVFVVRPGDAIPVDGVIVEGLCTIDESSLTGESLPVEKTKEEQVFSGTLNKSGSITVRATKVGQDSTINKIIKMVSEA
ncbi:MAG: cation-translocating P-type ATPase, partial [Treponema sp.]|nr:cation-translocating P-type ATPase [Treponema sp.]